MLDMYWSLLLFGKIAKVFYNLCFSYFDKCHNFNCRKYRSRCKKNKAKQTPPKKPKKAKQHTGVISRKAFKLSSSLSPSSNLHHICWIAVHCKVTKVLLAQAASPNLFQLTLHTVLRLPSFLLDGCFTYFAIEKEGCDAKNFEDTCVHVAAAMTFEWVGLNNMCFL